MQPQTINADTPRVVLEALHNFTHGGKTGHITLHFKEGRIMQVETTEVKRV